MIHPQMTIEEILSTFPDKAQKIAQALGNAGLNCVGCHAATWETLEAGVLGHGYTMDKLEDLVGKLNQIIEEKTDPSTITITPRAAKKYLEILDEERKHGWGVRFAEVMAGCNGFEYVLDYSEKAGDNDDIFESQGIEVHVDKSLTSRMLGSEIDYIDALQNSGFKVTNPNVKSSCGCGHSHGY